MEVPVALTGSDASTIALLFDVLSASTNESAWIIWDSTVVPCPRELLDKAKDQCLSYRAVVYAAECQILTLRRIVDRANADYAWTVDADLVTAKDVLQLPESTHQTADVLLGVGYSRFSRKALESIARDFGSGLDFSSLAVVTI